jgi:hypothetical protein
MWVTKHQNGAADGLSNDWAASDLNHAAPITSAGDRNDPLDLGPLSDP